MTDDLVARLREKARSKQTYGGVTLREAADALEAQAKEIATLEAQVSRLIQPYDDYDERIAELEAALKPFADKAKIFHDYVDDYPVMFGAEPPLRVSHFRAARAALKEES